MSTRALHRNVPVVCASCGRAVKRMSRQQRYCSDRCKEKGRGRVRKRFVGCTTKMPTNPPKRTNVSNELQASESRSRLINNAVQIEFFGGGHWQQVVSPDGVVTYVTRLWPMNSASSRHTINSGPVQQARRRRG
jgi:hypothetical protein